jgi:hypothetical protein
MQGANCSKRFFCCERDFESFCSVFMSYSRSEATPGRDCKKNGKSATAITE